MLGNGKRLLSMSLVLVFMLGLLVGVAHAQDEYELTEARVRNARHAYYGMISYIDDKVGRIMRTLEETGLAGNTLVAFAVDHAMSEDRYLAQAPRNQFETAKKSGAVAAESM